MKRRCHNCEERYPLEDTTLARRKVGGSYKRAALFQSCIICRSCLTDFLPRTAERTGQLTINQWDIHGLRRAAERLGLDVPEGRSR